VNVLVDMNLAPAWAGFLASHGIAAVHWSSIGAPAAPDAELMRWARDHDHVVFTNDLDFGALVALTGARGPSVVQVRTLDVLPATLGGRVVGLLRSCASDLESGAIVTLDGDSARVRVLPVRR
jgi:predicted nuclease of predicted toxin-antitoxin system